MVEPPENDPIADHPRIYIERRHSMEGSMGTMTDFWAREWLLEDIALRHAINDLDTAIQIGQQAGLLTSDAYLTDVGRRYVKIIVQTKLSSRWNIRPRSVKTTYPHEA